ncbi:MAG: response regulator [Treponemataceae bacterium]|nr:response regulator [Treponemataceae bacterium]
MAKKILIVDDSTAIRQSIVYILQQDGYEIAEAVDGLEGLSVLEKMDRVDLVITDINMPNMDGITLIKKIRQHERFKFLPIIVLTTESQGSKMNEGKEAGATGWIVKPFNAEKLLAVVKKIIG